MVKEEGSSQFLWGRDSLQDETIEMNFARPDGYIFYEEEENEKQWEMVLWSLNWTLDESKEKEKRRRGKYAYRCQ